LPLAKFNRAIENRKSRFEQEEFSIAVDFQEMAFIFENLDVYKKAIDFADEIYKLTKDFPKGNYYLADQLNRAALSISANIAEGNGRYHKADRTNFFRIARGSAFECIPLLEICRRRKLIDADIHNSLKLNLDDIGKMLSGLMK